LGFSAARKRRPIDVAARAIFRLSEFGAIACYGYAAFVLEHNYRNHRSLLDAAVFIGLGVIVYCVGWTMRYALSRETRLF
jgi:hypothetical protein